MFNKKPVKIRTQYIMKPLKKIYILFFNILHPLCSASGHYMLSHVENVESLILFITVNICSVNIISCIYLTYRKRAMVCIPYHSKYMQC